MMTNSKTLFLLEDDPERIKFVHGKTHKDLDLRHYENVDEAIVSLLDDEWAYPDLMLLDHDLGGQQYQDTREFNCGTTFARWLTHTDRISRGMPIVIHSQNAPAAQGMFDILRDAGYTSLHLIPFSTLRDNWDRMIRIT